MLDKCNGSVRSDKGVPVIENSPLTRKGEGNPVWYKEIEYDGRGQGRVMRLYSQDCCNISGKIDCGMREYGKRNQTRE